MVLKDRISRDEMLMEVAYVVRKRGTCSRLQVGAVVSRHGRIIATGYNGAPAGLPHCDHSAEEQPIKPVLGGLEGIDCIYKPGQIMVLPTEPTITTRGCQTAEHAERNAVAFAARYGLALEDSELHCTHAPCLDCARAIINAGIKRVTYVVPYRLTQGIELLQAARIEVVQMAATKDMI